MKNIVPLFTTLLLAGSAAQAQVTQLSSNTNIRSGIALGSIGVLSDNDGILWKTDGTAAGTVKYTSKVFIDTTINTAIFNNKIYFNGNAVGSGKELWVTDGTDAGTQLVKDIKANSVSSSPENLTVFNNALYFFATTNSNGTELWKTDGSNAGTVMVKDIKPGTASSYDSTYTSFFISNNILYFNANDGTHGSELWRTDGTDGGTVMVKDINPGSGSSNCQNFTTLGTNMLFSATDATHGTELWKSNGTDAGTLLVQDMAPAELSSYPGDFVVFNNKVIFQAFYGGGSGLLLCSTDGTSAGTTPLADFGPFGFAYLSTSVFINNKMYFCAQDPGQLGPGLFVLWSSDGTRDGTAVFYDNFYAGNIIPDFTSMVNGSTDVHIKLFNGKIFFTAWDGVHGDELWITDGVDSTSAHTHLVKDIAPGPESAFNILPSSWFYTANSFYFAADDGVHGNELYSTDGTEANTALVKDINPGADSSNPFMFMLLNNHIYFTADDGNDAGSTDLFIVDAETSLPVNLLSFAATPDNKAVDLQWTTVTENNTKNFVIQRSNDAIHFDNIGSVNAAGNSTTKKEYSFIDAGALNGGSKIVYYRLQIADNDGKLSNSKIAKVEIAPGSNVIAVYPNPVKDKLIIVTGRSLNNAITKITDQSGKIILIQKMQTIQAGEKNTINVARLGSGVYYLQLITGNSKQTTQFIKY